MAASAWKCLPCSRRQLRLDVVLQCGQSFRWRENNCGEWLGVLCGHVWRLKQDDTRVYYQVYNNRKTPLPHSDTKPKLPFIKEDSKDQLTDVRTSRARQSKSRTGVKPKADLQRPQAASKGRLLRQVRVKTEVPESSAVAPRPNTLDKALSDDAKAPRVKSEPQEKNDDDDDDSELSAVLHDYFQLDVDIEALYRQWSRADPYFEKLASDFWGIRMLRQDPVENLFAFICSSNNNIGRISGMVENLCLHYGEPVAEVDGTTYHSFPAVAALAQPGVEEKLRGLGFGYRAKFIATSARYIVDNHGEDWVSSLRRCSYTDARTELMKLCGVGAKVADCVCLMSLDKTEALPVDTHVWQFAIRHYLPRLQAAKSLTDKLYQETGDHFRQLWGQYAGWAQSVLFTAELRHMQSMKSSPDKTGSTQSGPKKKRVAGKSSGADPDPPKASKKK